MLSCRNVVWLRDLPTHILCSYMPIYHPGMKVQTERLWILNQATSTFWDIVPSHPWCTQEQLNWSNQFVLFFFCIVLSNWMFTHCYGCENQAHTSYYFINLSDLVIHDVYRDRAFYSVRKCNNCVHWTLTCVRYSMLLWCLLDISVHYSKLLYNTACYSMLL